MASLEKTWYQQLQHKQVSQCRVEPILAMENRA